MVSLASGRASGKKTETNQTRESQKQIDFQQKSSSKCEREGSPDTSETRDVVWSGGGGTDQKTVDRTGG